MGDDRSDRRARRAKQLPSEDPYADVDRELLPTWWRRAVEHFEEHDLGPYRPPRFTDGTFKHEVEADVESTFDVTIGFQCKNAEVGDDWTVTVDGDAIGTIGRHRSPKGYSVFEMRAAEFHAWVRDAINDS